MGFVAGAGDGDDFADAEAGVADGGAEERVVLGGFGGDDAVGFVGGVGVVPVRGGLVEGVGEVVAGGLEGGGEALGGEGGAGLEGALQGGVGAAGIDGEAVGVDLGEESGGAGVSEGAVDPASAGGAEEEAVPGAGDGDVGQAALFFEAFGGVVAEAGEELFFEADEEDGVELEALGAVDGHEGDGAGVTVGVGGGVLDEGGAVEEGPEGDGGVGGEEGVGGAFGDLVADGVEECRGVGVAVELFDGVEELADVLEAVLGGLGVVLGEVVLVGDAFKEAFDDRGEAVVVEEVFAGVVEDLSELFEAAAADTAEGAEIVEGGLLGGGAGARAVVEEIALRGELGVEEGEGILEAEDAVEGGDGGEFVEGSGADAALGGVEDSGGGDVVAGVQGGPEVGEDVLDLLASVEAEAADDAVGVAPLAELLLEEAALGVGAVEDGDVFGVGAGAEELEDTFGDVGGLLAVVAALEDDEGVALGAVGPEAFAVAVRVVGDDVVGGVEDARGGAVVLLEFDDPGGLKGVLEAEDMSGLGAAPAVDGLVVIADDGEVVVGRGEVDEELVLGGVGVLELVDHEEAPAAAEAFGEGGVLAEDDEDLEEEVAEVGAALAAELVLVEVVEAGESLGVGAEGILLGLIGGPAAVFLGVDEVLALADGAAAAVFAEAIEEGGDEATLVAVVVDGEVPVEAGPRREASKQAGAEAVEGGDDNPLGGLFVVEEGVDAVAHLGGGAVGEGDGDDGVRGLPVVVDQVGDAVGEDPGLAAAGAGEDEERAAVVEDGFALWGVEIVHGHEGERAVNLFRGSYGL